MELVKNNGEFWTEFNGKKYQKYDAKEVFNKIVDGAWKNGEPGLLFYDKINDSPYKYAGVEIKSSNPCGEQPLPPHGSCNLGSLDISKFFIKDKFDWELFDKAIRLSVRFLDSVIDVNSFPTKETEEVSLKSRQIGLGIMGVADLLMLKKFPYGSEDALNFLEDIFRILYITAKDESEIMGSELGIPEWCQKLPEPRRNITLISYAPTGTISLLAGCNSGIEPFFSKMTHRIDKTGEYDIEIPDSDKDYFRCAVSTDGETEVTWEEHIRTQAIAQTWCDSGVSKTINFPNGTHKETIAKAYMLAYELGCKGITAYRNGSRAKEVLSPKNIGKNKCPVCGEDVIKESGCTKCSKCDWSLCSVG